MTTYRCARCGSEEAETVAVQRDVIPACWLAYCVKCISAADQSFIYFSYLNATTTVMIDRLAIFMTSSGGKHILPGILPAVIRESR